MIGFYFTRINDNKTVLPGYVLGKIEWLNKGWKWSEPDYIQITPAKNSSTGLQAAIFEDIDGSVFIYFSKQKALQRPARVHLSRESWNTIRNHIPLTEITRI